MDNYYAWYGQVGESAYLHRVFSQFLLQFRRQDTVPLTEHLLDHQTGPGANTTIRNDVSRVGYQELMLIQTGWHYRLASATDLEGVDQESLGETQVPGSSNTTSQART